MRVNTGVKESIHADSKCKHLCMYRIESLKTSRFKLPGLGLFSLGRVTVHKLGHCVCVCVHVCMGGWVHICVCTCVYGWVGKHMCVHACVCIVSS